MKNTTRLKPVLAAFIVGAAGYFAWLPAAVAQQRQGQKPPAASTADDGPTQVNIGAWSYSCNSRKPDRKCSAVLRIFQEGTSSNLLFWSIQRIDQKTIRSGIVTPTGVVIGAGLELKIGSGAARRYSYASCETTGCAVEIPVDETMVKSINASEDVTAVIQNIKGQAVTVNFSANGVRQILTEMRR